MWKFWMRCATGTILGPLLFIVGLLYMNDIVVCKTYSKQWLLFTDDTTRFYSHKDIDMFYEKRVREVSIYNWFKANKLSINEFSKMINLVFLGTRLQTKMVEDFT